MSAALRGERLPWMVFDYIDGSAGADTGGSTQPCGSWVREFPLLFDSDLRSREYTLKPLFCGADFVFFGRILQYAITQQAIRDLNNCGAYLAKR